MTEQAVYAVVVTVAVVFGLFAGRVIAVEGQNRLNAVFAGTYVGAGASLVSAITMGALLVGLRNCPPHGSMPWRWRAKSLLAAGGAAAGLGSQHGHSGA